MVLEIEVPSSEVDRHFATAYRHLAEQTRVPGFRPGKAPRHVIDRFVGRGSVLAEAIDHLVNAAYDEALNQTDIIPLDHPQVDLDPAAVAEGQAVSFTATVAVRPDVQLGSYTEYPFTLETPEVTDADVDAVIAELRESQATLRPLDGAAAEAGHMAAVKFTGTIDGEPFEGGSADRLPLVIGENRMIPGWEEHLVGMTVDETRGFDIDVPGRLPGRGAARQAGAFRGRRCSTCARRCCPSVDDEFAEERRRGRQRRRAARRDPRRARQAGRRRGAPPRSRTGSSTSRSATPASSCRR